MSLLAGVLGNNGQKSIKASSCEPSECERLIENMTFDPVMALKWAKVTHN